MRLASAIASAVSPSPRPRPRSPPVSRSLTTRRLAAGLRRRGPSPVWFALIPPSRSGDTLSIGTQNVSRKPRRPIQERRRAWAIRASNLNGSANHRTNGQLAPLTGGQAIEACAPDRAAHQAQGGQADGRRHPADLPVAALPDHQLQPGVGHGLAGPHRRIARPQRRRCASSGRPPAGRAIAQLDARQALKLLRLRIAFTWTR